MKYDLNCPFDIELHKENIKGYLEVLILEDGTVMYAVPSHQELAMKLAQDKLHMTREEISCMCPREHYCDYLNWLLSLTESCSVWIDCVSAWRFTRKQVAKLRELKMAGLYRGRIPPVSQ